MALFSRFGSNGFFSSMITGPSIGGDRSLASFTRNNRQLKCTANCESTVRIVYALKMSGNGRSLDRVFSGCRRKK